jgi:hypothetical protein
MDIEIVFIGILKLLFAPFVPFIMHPERIAVVAVLWFIAAAVQTVWRKKLAWPLLVVSASWALFVAHESRMRIGDNIRIDLILICPVLLSVTLWGIAETIVPGITTRSFKTRFSLRTLMIVVTVVALALGLIAWLAR